ncbi:uncharacterized protein AB9W97_005961 isoform 1-T1 [Spinachia spinachia]
MASENSVVSLRETPFNRRSDVDKKRLKELGPEHPDSKIQQQTTDCGRTYTLVSWMLRFIAYRGKCFRLRGLLPPIPSVYCLLLCCCCEPRHQATSGLHHGRSPETSNPDLHSAQPRSPRRLNHGGFPTARRLASRSSPGGPTPSGSPPSRPLSAMFSSLPAPQAL